MGCNRAFRPSSQRRLHRGPEQTGGWDWGGACGVGSCTWGWHSTEASTMRLEGLVGGVVVEEVCCILCAVVGDDVVCIPWFQLGRQGRWGLVIYDQQVGKVVGEWGRSRNFTITAGVKQGCALSPRLFSATLEWALRGWKKASQGARIDLRDGFLFFCFFPLTPFCRDRVSGSCFTGQFPGIGTLFILASLQMCKVQGKVH